MSNADRCYFVATSKALLRSAELDWSVKGLLLALWDLRRCKTIEPGLEHLSKLSGMTPRQLRYACNKALNFDLLVIYDRGFSRDCRTSEYKFTPKSVALLSVEGQPGPLPDNVEEPAVGPPVTAEERRRQRLPRRRRQPHSRQSSSMSRVATVNDAGVATTSGVNSEEALKSDKANQKKESPDLPRAGRALGKDVEEPTTGVHLRTLQEPTSTTTLPPRTEPTLPPSEKGCTDEVELSYLIQVWNEVNERDIGADKKDCKLLRDIFKLAGGDKERFRYCLLAIRKPSAKLDRWLSKKGKEPLTLANYAHDTWPRQQLLEQGRRLHQAAVKVRDDALAAERRRLADEEYKRSPEYQVAERRRKQREAEIQSAMDRILKLMYFSASDRARICYGMNAVLERGEPLAPKVDLLLFQIKAYCIDHPQIDPTLAYDVNRDPNVRRHRPPTYDALRSYVRSSDGQRIIEALAKAA
jgi:hypothetical protein